MKRITSLLLALTLAFSLCVPALAEDAAGTTLRLEETTGTVKVKDAAGADKTARTGMRLYNGYTVETGASSSGYISLDDTKAVKLDASGKVEIKKNGKKLEVSLTAGQLFFNVTEPLKVDESLNIRTATMVTGIRGSFGWVNGTEIGLLHGHVTLTCINPETSAVRVTEVYSGEKVSYEAGASSAAADPELLEIDFVKEPVTLEDVPVLVVEQVASDETLQAQLAEYAAEAKAENAAAEVIDVKELVDSLETKQAAEAAAETAAQAEAAAAAAAQETAIAVAATATATESGSAAGTVYLSNTTEGTDSGYTGAEAAATTATAGGGGGGDSGSTTYTVTDATQLTAALADNNDVTFTGTGTATNLSIANGKTLTVASGADLTLAGTSENLSSNTLINNGTLTISGTFNNGGATAGRFVNNGTLIINSGASFVNKANGTFNGSKSFAGGGALKFTVTFETNGGSTVTDDEYISDVYIGAPTAPTRTGYAFDGWYKDSSLTTAWAFDSDSMPNDNMTLYAKWLTVTTETVFVTDSSVSISGGKLLEVIEIDGASRTLTYIGSSQSFTSARWYEMEVDSNNEIHSATLVPTQGRSMQSATLNSDAATISSDGSIYTCSDSTVFLVTTAASGKVTTPPDNVYTGIGTASITPSTDGVDSANMFFVYSGTTVQYAVILGTSTTTSGTGGGSITGTTGTNVTWALTTGSDGSGMKTLTLSPTVSGTTASIDDFSSMTDRPWNDQAASINAVVIGSGISIIGASAFNGFTSLTSVTIPSDVTYIGTSAFAGCSQLASVVIQGDPTIAQVAFAGCNANLSVTSSGSLRNWGSRTFYTSTFPTGVRISGTDSTEPAPISYEITMVSGRAAYNGTDGSVTIDGNTYSSDSYSTYCTKGSMDASVNNMTVDLYLVKLTGDTASTIINYAK